MGGNRDGPFRTYLNLFLTMLLGGLWHGAAWNFVLWGMWHGAGLIAHRLWNRDAAETGGRVGRWMSWVVTMLFVLYGWLLFRANSWSQIVSLTKSLGHFALPVWTTSYLINLAVFTLPLVTMEFWQKRSDNLLVSLTLPAWARSALQGALLTAIVLFWGKAKVPFIYFQF